MRKHTLRGFAAAIGILMLVAGSVPAHAASRQGSSTATVTGALPGQVLWTDFWGASQVYDYPPFHIDDTIIRLINPNGGANTGITGIQEHPECAMFYVFDDEQEMLECCGCPISSAGLMTVSVGVQLLDNEVFGNDDLLYNGVIAIVASAPNPNISTLASPSNGLGCTVGQSGACNSGCDPTNNPGYTVTTDNNLLGSRTLGNPARTFGPAGLVESALHDDGAGDPANLTYLQAECGVLVGNASGAGICTCPVPGEAQPSM